jgi:hypothetical protein
MFRKTFWKKGIMCRKYRTVESEHAANPGTPSGYESRQGTGGVDGEKGAERIAIEQYQIGQDVLPLS